MKKLILTCALLTSVSLLSFGQNTAGPKTTAAPPPQQNRQAPAPEKMAEMRANRYKSQLGLTDEQYKGVYNAELSYVKQDQANRAAGISPEMGPSQQLMMTHDQQFKQILTPDQYTKYDKMRAVNRPGMGAQPNAAPNTPAGVSPANH